MLKQLFIAWRHKPTHNKVWALAVPMILSNLTVPLVGLVNSAVIGHLPHAHQLGAVAVGTSFYAVLASLAGTLRMGTTGFTAQAAGQHDGEALHRLLFQSIALAWAFALILLITAMPVAQAVLNAMGTSAELANQANSFFQIRLFGLPAILTQHALVGWFLGTQNARTPLIIMMVTNICNILLVVWLVVGMGWGIEGAATASVLAEWAGVIFGGLAVHFYLAKVKQPVNWSTVRQWHSWKALLKTNADIFLRTIALQAVFLTITLRGANLGDNIVAANALLLNGLMVCSYALDGLAHAVEALCGHAIGAKKRKGLQRALVVSGGWSFIISIVFAIGFAIFGHQFIAIQTNMPDVRETAYIFLPYLAVLPIIAVWSFLLDGLFIGATKGREMRNTMLLSVVLTVPVAITLSSFGNHGLWITLLAFMFIRSLVMGLIAWNMQKRNLWIPTTA